MPYIILISMMRVFQSPPGVHCYYNGRYIITSTANKRTLLGRPLMKGTNKSSSMIELLLR